MAYLIFGFCVILMTLACTAAIYLRNERNLGSLQVAVFPAGLGILIAILTTPLGWYHISLCFALSAIPILFTGFMADGF